MSARRLAVAIVACGAALAMAATVAPAAGSGSHIVVARVVKVTGEHRFYVKRHGHLRPLHAGDRIIRHELVVLGPRTHALLRLLLNPRSPVPDEGYVLSIHRFHGRQVPPISKLATQWALLGHAAKTRRWLEIEPRLLELRP